MPSSVILFSSCLQSFPVSGSFLMSWLFASGGQSIGASASASVLPMNIQDWFPLGLTGWISLQSRTLKSLLQYHSSKASILQCSAFFISFVHFFLSLNNILFYGYATTLFIYSPIKGYLGCFCFWQLWLKLIETFVCRFLGVHKFSTLLVNTKEDSCWIVCKNIFSFIRNYQTPSKVPVLFFILTSND